MTTANRPLPSQRTYDADECCFLCYDGQKNPCKRYTNGINVIYISVISWCKLNTNRFLLPNSRSPQNIWVSFLFFCGWFGGARGRKGTSNPLTPNKSRLFIVERTTTHVRISWKLTFWFGQALSLFWKKTSHHVKMSIFRTLLHVQNPVKKTATSKGRVRRGRSSRESHDEEGEEDMEISTRAQVRRNRGPYHLRRVLSWNTKVKKIWRV